MIAWARHIPIALHDTGVLARGANSKAPRPSDGEDELPHDHC